MIDPVGFALESFDVLGGWRTVDERGNPVDSAGTWPSGRKLDGFTGLRAMLLDRPEGFVGTLTEKLLAYALGRRLEYYDRPAVRKIVRAAAAQQHRWSSAHFVDRAKPRVSDASHIEIAGHIGCIGAGVEVSLGGEGRRA